MRRLTLALAGLLGFLCTALLAYAGAPYDARVVRVFDGDTVWVEPLAGGRWRKLRLDGIDAPEICQDGGVAARDALGRQVLGQTVQVVERARDDYGRGLAQLLWRGEDINAWLVRSGHAWAYRWRGHGPWVAEEQAAREARRGLFALGDPQPPHAFRRSHGPCRNPPRSLSAVR